MEGKTKLLGYPLHPILVALPLTLLTTAALFDLVYLLTGKPLFTLIAFWIMTLGNIGAIVTMAVGLRDWWAIPRGTRARTIGWHMD